MPGSISAPVRDGTTTAVRRRSPSPASALSIGPRRLPSRADLGRLAPGRLTVFATGTHERVGDVEAGPGPPAVRSAPDGRLACVSCVVPSTVDVVGARDATAPDPAVDREA
ncbi:hypothetical protein ADK64_34570 [Streptomyces sp. MMG1121]|nr:hypothetical protein ADK64_34570 [Streptomyces sp. MMG1121]